MTRRADYDPCPTCMDNPDPMCWDCDGTGKIPVTAAELRADARDEAADRAIDDAAERRLFGGDDD